MNAFHDSDRALTEGLVQYYTARVELRLAGARRAMLGDCER